MEWYQLHVTSLLIVARVFNTRVDPDRSGKTGLTSSLLNLTMKPKLAILKAV